ncbi:Uncharacterised protein [Klebsiella aerogenes]|nr:Uncharacterised protein [Klebsiella aerogenes]
MPEKNGLHNYLRLPELVEDVCNAYLKQYGHESYGLLP